MPNTPVRIGGVLYPSQEWYDSHHGGGTPAPVTPPTPVAPTLPPPAVAPAPVAPTAPVAPSPPPTAPPAPPVQPTPTPVAPSGLPMAGRLPFPQNSAEMEAYQARQAAGEITFNGTDWVYANPQPQAPVAPAPAPAPAPIPATPVPQPAPTAPPTTSYQIASGDTLSEIATKNGTTVDAIMAANPQITDPNKIYAGQSLNLPANGEAPILPTAPAVEEPQGTTVPGEPVETVEEIQDQPIDVIVDNALQEFGVDMAAQDWLNFPEFSFENVISDLLEGMGWADLQADIKSIQEELDTAVANRDEAVGTIRENPWLDQSMQLGRIGRTQDKAQAEITRLQNKLTLATNTAIRVEEKAELYSAKALTQYSSEKEYAKDKYDYLLQRAKTDIEAKLAERAEIKAEEQFRYTEAANLAERGDVLNLTPSQKSAGNLLAKQLYGSTAIKTEFGYNNLVVPILQRMAGGEGIDAIADDLRFQGQSVGFTGTIRAAAQQITSKLSAGKTETIFDKLDDILSTGDTGAMQDYLKKISLDQAGAEQAKTIMGSERTVEFLDEIYQDLADFEAGGGDTNIFTGTLEAISAKAGSVKDAELRKIATKITKARQQYRRAMTGVAFSPGENEEYDAIFPNIDKTSDFNTATIDGLREAMKGDVDFFYGFTMGQDNYQELFKGGGGTSDGLSDEDAYQEYLNIIG